MSHNPTQKNKLGAGQGSVQHTSSKPTASEQPTSSKGKAAASTSNEDPAGQCLLAGMNGLKPKDMKVESGDAALRGYKGQHKPYEDLSAHDKHIMDNCRVFLFTLRLFAAMAGYMQHRMESERNRQGPKGSLITAEQLALFEEAKKTANKIDLDLIKEVLPERVSSRVVDDVDSILASFLSEGQNDEDFK